MLQLSGLISVLAARLAGTVHADKKIDLLYAYNNFLIKRFKHIVDLENGEKLHTLGHEIRSMTHPLYGRPMINRKSELHNNNNAAGYSDRTFMLKGEELRQ